LRGGGSGVGRSGGRRSGRAGSGGGSSDRRGSGGGGRDGGGSGGGRSSTSGGCGVGRRVGHDEGSPVPARCGEQGVGMAAGRRNRAAAASCVRTAGRGAWAEAGVGKRVAKHEEGQTYTMQHTIARMRAADQRPLCTHCAGAIAPQVRVRGDRQRAAGRSPGRRQRVGCGGAAGGPLPVPLLLSTEPCRQRGLDRRISLAPRRSARARALTSNRASLAIGRRGMA